MKTIGLSALCMKALYLSIDSAADATMSPVSSVHFQMLSNCNMSAVTDPKVFFPSIVWTVKIFVTDHGELLSPTSGGRSGGTHAMEWAIAPSSNALDRIFMLGIAAWKTKKWS